MYLLGNYDFKKPAMSAIKVPFQWKNTNGSKNIEYDGSFDVTEGDFPFLTDLPSLIPMGANLHLKYMTPFLCLQQIRPYATDKGWRSCLSPICIQHNQIGSTKTIWVMSPVVYTTQAQTGLHLISYAPEEVVKTSTPSLQPHEMKAHYHWAATVKSKMTSGITATLLIGHTRKIMHQNSTRYDCETEIYLASFNTNRFHITTSRYHNIRITTTATTLKHIFEVVLIVNWMLHILIEILRHKVTTFLAVIWLYHQQPYYLPNLRLERFTYSSVMERQRHSRTTYGPLECGASQWIESSLTLYSSVAANWQLRQAPYVCWYAPSFRSASTSHQYWYGSPRGDQ